MSIIGNALAEYKINPAHYMIALKYMEAFQQVALAAKKRSIYFPYETDVTGALSFLMNTKKKQN